MCPGFEPGILWPQREALITIRTQLIDLKKYKLKLNKPK